MAAQQYDSFLKVWIDGKPMEDFRGRVSKVEVSQRSSDASSFRMLMSMAPSDHDTWALLEDERFELMRRVTIVLGVGPYGRDEGEQEAVIFDGFITGVEPFFGPQRSPDSTLEVSGLDASCLMHFEARCVEWKGMTDAEIVKKIYQSYGFTAEVVQGTATPMRKPNTASLLQRGTDAEFVRMLARRNGFEWYVESDDSPVAETNHPGKAVIGHFRPPRVEQAPPPEPLTLMPQKYPSLIELRARWDSHRPTSVVAKHIDPRSRRIWSAVQDKPKLLQMGKSTRLDLLRDKLAALKKSATLEPVGLQRGLVPHDEAELKAFAWADYCEGNWLAEASGRVQGQRYGQILQARRPVEVNGGGKLVDGLWYVRSASHLWRPAEPDDAQHTERYVIDIELVRNALGKPD